VKIYPLGCYNINIIKRTQPININNNNIMDDTQETKMKIYLCRILRDYTLCSFKDEDIVQI